PISVLIGLLLYIVITNPAEEKSSK
ncbi:unnamed protein product, partial [Allacma fusca]